MGWSLLSIVVFLVAFGFGAPFLLRGGGLLRRRGTFRYKVRFRGGGPGAGALVVLALLRRADTVAFALVTAAVLILIVVNARA